MSRAALAVIPLFLACSAATADELTVLPDRLEGGPTRQMLSRYLQGQADQAFARRQAAYEKIATAADCQQRQEQVRGLLLEELGELPERTPLNAQVVGAVDGDGYRMERLIYESQPRHYVTAILFLPKSKPPYPAVLVPCGHSRDGKASNQRVCILLAKHGIAAMSYDPIGQGERYQLLDGRGQPRFKSTDEHTLLGATCMLVGRNTATYRIWDGIRSLDYLCSRPEIDAARIGVTGCSGGGTLTSYLMALDERVACAAPSCYLTSLPRLLATIGPQDAEQNIHAQIALGIDHADYALLRAPKPTLILASTRDFFDIQGTWDTFRQAKRFYTRLGFPERIELVETDATHGYPRPQREAMARWMSRWLLGRDEPLTEPDFATHAEAEVQCSPQGQVMRIEGARSVMDLNAELDARLKEDRRRLWEASDRGAPLAEVRRIAGIRRLDEIPRPKARSAGAIARDGYTIEKLVLEPEDGIALPALLFKPERANGRRRLYLHGSGKHVDAQPGGPIEALTKQGELVLAIDLRGTGETGPGGGGMWGGEWKSIFLAYLLGKSMVGMRAEDILVAARRLAELDTQTPAPVNVTAIGAAGPPALHAVALEQRLFGSLRLPERPRSWSDSLRDPAMPGQLVHAVHGALLAYDLPDLIDSLPKEMLAHRDDAKASQALTAALKDLPAEVFPADQREQLRGMVRRQQARRIQEVNQRSSDAWSKIDGRPAWERFREPRLQALRRSLGRFPDPPSHLQARVTGEIPGDGYRIENIVFPSRPGLWVTANLYLPATPSGKAPGILICHSHHRPKEHGELQDMGMTWARAGCVVLVMDQLGHGERRQHPFGAETDYPGEFRLSRQDYYFRYDTSLQLDLAGESLIGWMASDLMRGVDLLRSRSEVDSQEIILLGAVAGGGDPAAVAAALDERIAAAVPFNFGGPQPETRYPLPDDAEASFNYAGSGSWESTRNLRRSAAEGFLPWVIVGAIAPRRLVYAHEFNWDRPRDPVWRRLERIYGFYERPERLAYTHGRGELRGQPPEATHCTHIGAPHRVMIHASLKAWFGVPVTPDVEYSQRLPAERLVCMTSQAEQQVQPQSLSAVLCDVAQERINAAQVELSAQPVDAQRRSLQQRWSALLGGVSPEAEGKVVMSTEEEALPDGVSVARMALESEPGITLPLLLLLPATAKGEPLPLVVAVSQSGKEELLRRRSDEIARFLGAGVAVCLPDVRGAGETRAGDDRSRQSADTSLSSTELMLGGTMVGARLRDLRAVLHYLRSRNEIDSRRIALWGDSTAEVNSPETEFNVPHGVSGRPRQCEPLGGLLALFGGLFEEEVAAVAVQGGLTEFRSALESPVVCLPHDAVIPGALTAGDLCDVAAALAPRPLCLSELADPLNRRAPLDQAQAKYRRASEAYRAAGHEDRFLLGDDSQAAADWLLRQLRQ